jgi:hypothetical protein
VPSQGSTDRDVIAAAALRSPYTRGSWSLGWTAPLILAFSDDHVIAQNCADAGYEPAKSCRRVGPAGFFLTRSADLSRGLDELAELGSPAFGGFAATCPESPASSSRRIASESLGMRLL